jgi:hypothetical protein
MFGLESGPTVEGADGGELLDAPNFGGGGAQKNQAALFTTNFA